MTLFAAFAAVIAMTGVNLAGQAAGKSGAPEVRSGWTAPKGPDGHPDLSGIWEHNAATPLQRPDELNGRAMLTDEELKQMERKSAEIFKADGDAAFGDSVYTATLRNVLGTEKGFSSRDTTTGDYDAFWVVGRWFEKRTSLIENPADGKLPAVTDAARERRREQAEYRRQHPYDGPEDIALGQRCITGSVPMLGAGYNNYYQIVQTPQTFAVNMEMRHDTRMVNIGTRPHLPKDVRLWLGDPVGHWEGEQFVVDTTNFRDDSPVGQGGGATPTTHLVEKFSLAAPDTLRYEATMDDPATWTKPWTAVLYMKRTKDLIYEYACHEGNEAMVGTLNGARVQERKAEGKGTSTGSRQQ
jgi:hypothetical protein